MPFPARLRAAVLPALLVAALVAAAGLRLWHVGRAPFWLDEAYSAYAADHGWRFLWQVVPRYETHPPLYYSLVHLWSLAFGETVLARRLLGMVCGSLAVVVTVLAGWRLAVLQRLGRRTGWLVAMVALLAALHPELIAMARQVRPYPVMALVYAIGILALIDLARDTADDRAPNRRAIAIVCAAEAPICWLHSLGPLYGGALALGLAIVTLRRGLTRGDWAWLVGGQIAVALVYLPGALILADQSTGWIASTWLKFRPARLVTDLGSLYATWQRPAMIAGGLLAIAGFGLMLRDRRGRRAGVALLLLAVLPTAASLALSVLVTPLFIVRTLSPVAVPALLLIARGATWPRWGRFAALLPLGVLLWSMAWGAARVVTAPPMQDWYATARWLAARWSPGDAVWSYPNEAALALDYANRDLGIDRIAVTPIPTPVPAIGAGGYYPTGSRGVVTLYPAEIARRVAQPDAILPETIWLMRMGAWTYDPGDALLKALEAHRVRVGRWRSGPVEIIGLQRLAADAALCKPSGRAAPTSGAAAR